MRKTIEDMLALLEPCASMLLGGLTVTLIIFVGGVVI